MKPKRQRRAHTPRVYVQHGLTAGQAIELDRRTAHHLLTVQRMPSGARVILFNGDGQDYHGTLRPVGKALYVDIETPEAVQRESTLGINLAQCISRGERMDTTLRMACELGVHAIQPLHSRHAQKRLEGERLQRKQQHWQQILISAAEQSGRNRLPELHAPLDLDQWLDEAASGFVLDPEAEHGLNAQSISAGQPVNLLVGPESGLERDEIDAAERAGLLPLRFGPRILRTETAGPAMIAVLQARLGDLGR